GTVIGTACLSIYVSVTTRRTRDAMLRILVLLIAGLTVPSVLRETFLHSTLTVDLWVYETLDQFRAMNPFVFLFSRMHTASPAGHGNLDSLSLFVRNVALGSAVFLGLAVVQVRRTHLRAAARAGAQRRRPLRW